MKHKYMNSEKIVDYIMSQEPYSIDDALSTAGLMIEDETVENYDKVNEAIAELTADDITNWRGVYNTTAYTTLVKLFEAFEMDTICSSVNKVVIDVVYKPTQPELYQIHFDSGLCVMFDIHVKDDEILASQIDLYFRSTIESIIYEAYC